MRKVIQAFCLFLCTALVTVQTAQAANPSAANIFNSIGGTTTIDRGGAIHSQARSIYSLGGGMTTFGGKRVSLLAADPPSFSAGCNGISWHFGGFAFISLDEIRQLVEAVAQASLGIAVDLAMQTLCPQCYAVMSKLRDMSNLMRNAAADACTIATNMGKALSDAGIFTPQGRAKECSTKTAGEGKTNGVLDSWAGSACRMLADAETELNKSGVMDFLKLGNTMSGTKPTKEVLDLSGNVTYKALSALGYEDGPVKDLMLSILGMTIVGDKSSADCSEVFQNLVGSPKALETEAGFSADEKAILNKMLPTASKETVVPANDNAAPKPSDKKTNPATPQEGGSAKGVPICHAPPLLSGLKDVGRVLLCGAAPQAEGRFFASKFFTGGFEATPMQAFETLKNTSLGAMCLEKMNASESNPLVYSCPAGETGECRQPKMMRMTNMVAVESKLGYTGLAWMVGDALQSGIVAVRDNKALPDDTKRILTGSGWPLYRLINMAAVYPALAGELVNAYSAAIAAQYAMDSLDKVARVGTQPGISMKSVTGLRPQDITVMREQIMDLVRQGDHTKTAVLNRLAEKRQLVDVVMQVNKALQAEVIGQGLSGNASLAVSIKRQLTERQAKEAESKPK